MPYNDVSSPAVSTHPDLDLFLDNAKSNQHPISLKQARDMLGDRLRESLLARETVIIRNGEDIWLTSATWIKVLSVLKNQEHACPSDAPHRPFATKYSMIDCSQNGSSIRREYPYVEMPRRCMFDVIPRRPNIPKDSCGTWTSGSLRG
jgi:hypothetical protein